MRSLARLRETVQTWRALRERLATNLELMDLAAESSDQAMLDELAVEAQDLSGQAEDLEFELTLSGSTTTARRS